MTQTSGQPDKNTILKKEIEKKFGQQIATSKECIMLADDILSKTSVSINFNTIRRFYGLVKSKYPVSKSTIKILLGYCDFNSLEELVISGLTKTDENDQDILLNYLITIFKNTPVTKSNDETFNSFVRITIQYLHENIPLMESLQREIAKTRNGIEFYFERNVNYDKLNSFFGNGLHHYMSESGTPEKKAFALSLLCVRDWLICNDASLENNLEIIKTLNLQHTAPGFIWGMYFSAFLLHANSFAIDPEKILIEAFALHDNFRVINAVSNASQSFEYIFSNALILTGNYEQALYYINYIFKNYATVSTQNDNYCSQKLLLLKAIALSKLKRTEEAKKLYQLLKPSKFYFFSVKIDTALYLILTKEINKGKKNADLQLKKIVADSGFTRLQKIA